MSAVNNGLISSMPITPAALQEKTNDRGLGLNSAEMMRAYIIQQVAEADRIQVNPIMNKELFAGIFFNDLILFNDMYTF